MIPRSTLAPVETLESPRNTEAESALVTMTEVLGLYRGIVAMAVTVAAARVYEL